MPYYLSDKDTYCSVCFERVKQRFSKRQRRFILLNAVRLEGLLYHPACIKNTWKAVEDATGVDPHLGVKK